MRFVWPAQRYDRLTRGPATLATALTIIACLVTAMPLVTIYRAAQRPSRPSNEQSPESRTFLRQLRREAVAARAVRVKRPASSVIRALPAREKISADTRSLAPVRSGQTPANDTSSLPASDLAAPAARPVGPVMAPSGFAKVIVPEAAKDSIAKRMAAYYLKLYQTFELTPEQKDSAGREQAQRAVAARDDHRPLAIPLFSVPLRMPFGGAYKSREQQRKDSAVNADNLQRLTRLAERARAKRDSTMRATLAAKRDTDDRRDSLLRVGRPRP